MKTFLLLAGLILSSHSAISQADSVRTKHKIALNISGWLFGNNRLDRDDSNEDGKIIYQIRVDGNGNIVSARPMQQTVSPSTETFYRRQVIRFKLRPKGSSLSSDLTVGTLTIDIEPGTIRSQPRQDIIGKSQPAFYLSVSVIRYQGKVIDVSPISRDYYGEEDRSTIVHKLSRYSLDPSDALELVSNYDWHASGDKLYKSYSAYNQKDPVFLTKSIESFRIK
ncbi:hypothetical protein [uncultured Fibrella sp.]|uniref:hypothetical protein n=1 Tax=uncultured Fibrella sp. TaxID=1284596 RepID=UPI0035C9BECE